MKSGGGLDMPVKMHTGAAGLIFGPQVIGCLSTLRLRIRLFTSILLPGAFLLVGF